MINQIHQGDCLDVMKRIPDNTVDTIITDPPYGLTFMGKDWDRGVPGIAFWREMFRACKPGATLLSFGGTRTFHRLTVTIEDAGWEIRDCMMWLYGSGFPKSLDISKAIDKAKGAERQVVGKRDTLTGRNKESNTFMASPRLMDVTVPATDLAKQWDGWGTALKPAWEPIIVAMKPTEGTYADNAEKYGVAGLNVDGGRIKSEEKLVRPQIARNNNTAYGKGLGVGVQVEPQGRWPANLILDEEAGKLLDEQSGHLHGSGNKNDTANGKDKAYSASSYEVSYAGRANRDYGSIGGGASRFFYCAKASKSERGEANIHPTVKPLKLMEYLCTLTKTPTGGIVLDPFVGSGTTALACKNTDRQFIGIESNPEYADIAKARIGIKVAA